VQLEQSQVLMWPTSFEEVEELVKRMAPRKSPGPDNLTMDLCQAGWSILGIDIWEMVKESRTSKGILQAFNATFITLILNLKGANTVDKFLPVSLCNFIYKIIIKLIVARLKPILSLIIS